MFNNNNMYRVILLLVLVNGLFWFGYCGQCEAGKHWLGTECVDCRAGFYCDGSSSKKCELGTFSDAGAVTCELCLEGYYCPGKGNTRVTMRNCPNGKTSPKGSMIQPDCDILSCGQLEISKICSGHGECVSIGGDDVCVCEEHWPNCSEVPSNDTLPPSDKDLDDCDLSLVSIDFSKLISDFHFSKSAILIRYHVPLVCTSVSFLTYSSQRQKRSLIYSGKESSHPVCPNSLAWDDMLECWRKNYVSKPMIQGSSCSVWRHVNLLASLDLLSDYFSTIHQKNFVVGSGTFELVYLNLLNQTATIPFDVRFNISSATWEKELAGGFYSTEVGSLVQKSHPLAHECVSFLEFVENDDGLHDSVNLKFNFLGMPDIMLDKLILEASSNASHIADIVLISNGTFNHHNNSCTFKYVLNDVNSFIYVSCKSHLLQGNYSLMGHAHVTNSTNYRFLFHASLHIDEPGVDREISILPTVLIVSAVIGAAMVGGAVALTGGLTFASTAALEGGSTISNGALSGFSIGSISSAPLKMSNARGSTLAMDFSFDFASPLIEIPKSESRSLHVLMKDLRFSKYTSYSHCKDCFMEQIQAMKSQQTMHDDLVPCIRCGCPLIWYIHSEPSDRFCVLCSLMNRYLNLKHGSHYRCSIHPSKKSNTHGSIYVLYQKYFSVSNAHRSRKATKKSQKLSQFCQLPIWNLNSVIRLEFLQILQPMINDERSAYLDPEAISHSLNLCRQRFQEIPNDVNDSRPFNFAMLKGISYEDIPIADKQRFLGTLRLNLRNLELVLSKQLESVGSKGKRKHEVNLEPHKRRRLSSPMINFNVSLSPPLSQSPKDENRTENRNSLSPLYDDSLQLFPPPHYESFEEAPFSDDDYVSLMMLNIPISES